jgi:hypothetical protein
MANKVSKFLLHISLFLLLVSLVLAHGEIEDYSRGLDIHENAMWVVVLAGSITMVLILISMAVKLSERRKSIVFFGIYSAGSTVYLNVISETNGPVHWHLDFEIWHCGQQVNLKDPTGLSNRIGTPVHHEHGDNRIHVEGVVIEKNDVDLHTFFEVIGGDLDSESVMVPTNNGELIIKNGDDCNGVPGTLQAFRYSVIDGYATQNTDFENYILSPFINVPPGDCIILEFGEVKEKTDKLCETYKVAVEKGRMKIGS